MLKIMIVDDEYYFRQALKVTLQWEELGFEICGEAKNGKDALDKIEELRPDIILVDINMPIMGGLEFISILKEQKYKAKIVLITGYSEFNYAKQAIQLGVTDYILKPIEEKELEDTLLNIKKLLKDDQYNQIEIEKFKTKAKENIPVLKEKLLNDLIFGNTMETIENIIASLGYLDIKLSSKYYRVIVMKIDCIDEKEWAIEEKSFWYFGVLNISSEILKERFSFEYCFDRSGCVSIIIGHNNNDEDTDFQVILLCEKIRECIKKYLKFTVTIGIGNYYEKIKNIEISYKEAIFALKNDVVIGSDSTISYSSIEEKGLMHTLFKAEQRNELLMSMRMGDLKEIDSLISEIFIDLRKANVNHGELRVISVQLITCNIEYILECGLNYSDVFTEIKNPMEEVQFKKSVNEIEHWIKEFIFKAIKYINNNKQSKSTKVVKKVIDYIEENFGNSDLKVEDISKYVFINYSHLCYIFKREVGKTIIEYLTEVRIKKAKELIDMGNKVIIDVAIKVGYEDANYFSRCFKKSYGVPPSKYIENINK